LVRRCSSGWVIHMATEGLVRAAVVCSEEERRLVVDARRVKVQIEEARKVSACSTAAAAVVVPC
jgi:3-polyprenyl-4-hydroxybenzoate decarboxylase